MRTLMLTGELVSKVFMSAFEFIDVFNGARRSLAKRIEGGRVPPTASVSLKLILKLVITWVFVLGYVTTKRTFPGSIRNFNVMTSLQSFHSRVRARSLAIQTKDFFRATIL